MKATTGSRKAGIAIGWIALVALAAVLRLGGLDKLQPHLQEADPSVVQQVQIHREGRDGRNNLPATYYAYPTMLARVLARLPEMQVAPGTSGDEYLTRSLAAASADHVRVRTAVALSSILLVPLTWLLARRFLGAGPALVAAALVAFSALHLLFSQQARPHGPQATCALAAVVLALRMRARPTFGAYLAGGACFALALGFLHNGIAALLPLLAAHLLRERRTVRFPWWGAAVLFVPAALVYRYFYPSPPTLPVEGGVLEFGGHTLPFDKLDGSGFALVAGYLWDYEPALLVASLLGLLAGAGALLAGRRGADEDRAGRRADLLVACSYAVPYLLALGLMGLTQDRFLIPLLPFLACLAAWPVALLRARPVAAWVFALAVLAFPSFVVARYVELRAAPDTVEQAAEWVREHVAPAASAPPAAGGAPAGSSGGRVLTTARLTLPLLHAPEALRVGAEDYATRKTMWLGWQAKHLPLEDGAPFEGGPRWNLFVTPGRLLNMNKGSGRAQVDDWLARADADFAVVEVSRLMAFIPGAALLREVLAERGELLLVLRGEDPRWCLERPLDYQEVPAFVPRLLRASAFGPCIEIYRLGR